jgi:hypothetical protein
MPARARRSRGALRVLAVAASVVAMPACQGILEPFPEPLPPNILITCWPEPGSTLDAAAVDRVELRFDRRMDPASLGFVRRMSFLLPLSVEDFAGRWSPDQRSVVFDLTQFPVQPGTLYEATFSGLRTADGDLYNLGPYRVWFRTRGLPDLFPMQVEDLLAARPFCRRVHADSTACASTSTLHFEAAGTDTLALRRECSPCSDDDGPRRDLFRRAGPRLEWVGFDVLAPDGTAARTVRWPEPPALFAAPVHAGDRLEATAQESADGTRLESWSAVAGGIEEPVHYVDAPGLPIQLVFSQSRVVSLQSVVVHADGRRETRHERWWLCPGLGLVQRDGEVWRSDRPGSRYAIESWAPTLSED